MADAMNSKLAAVANEEDVQDWPPLHYTDVVAWSRCATRVTQMSPVELNEVLTTNGSPSKSGSQDNWPSLYV